MKQKAAFMVFFCHFFRVRWDGAFDAVFLEAAGFRGGVLPFASDLGNVLPLTGAFEGAPPALGGIARIRHLGPEPIRSSRWALISASRTR